MKVEKSKG